ncbi:MAG: FAD-binding oxidoreductase [Desulfovermiculus sp.]|nr:FAD-binding oxidoreductase [Desulfovermiculus sp.]
MLETVYWKWGEEDDWPQANPPLPGNTGVLIVGAGYTGLSAALALAQSGLQVTVVDQETGPGQGASGRNGGMVLSGFPLDCSSLIQRFGLEQAKALFAASLNAVGQVEEFIRQEGISCNYRQTEHITAAVHPNHRDWLYQEQESMARISGRLPRVLDPEEMHETLGTDRYWGGLADPWAAALNPVQYATGLYNMALAAGVNVYWHTRVQGLDRDQSGMRVFTSRGGIQADRVLVAANGLVQGLDPWLSKRVVPVESVIMATEEIPPEVMATVLPKENTVSDTKRVLHYFRRSPDGKRLLFGGRPPLTWGSLRNNALALHRDMCAVYPQLTSYRPACVWSGRVGFTRDHMPHAGERNGQLYALGYCGHGIALASYLGRQAAKALLGRENPHALPFPHPSFPGFPLYRKRAWFIPPTLAWFSLLDRWGK